MTNFSPYPVGAPQIVMWDPSTPGFPYSTRWDVNAAVWDSGTAVWDGGSSKWDSPANGETFWLGS